jgi:uncharacterized membrane protein
LIGTCSVASAAAATHVPADEEAAGRGSSTGDQRVLFLDVARATALLMMVLGHTIDALLNPEFRGTIAFNAWTYVRGLTPSTFLFVSGFTLGVVTLRGRVHSSNTGAYRRLRRGLLLGLFGYALHFPAANVAGLWNLDASQWRSFAAVDILQTIGVALVCLQLVALACPSPRALAVAGISLGVAVCLMTPVMWTTRWEAHLPAALAAYLSPSTGSLFPLFPWLGYAAIGTGLAAVFHVAAGSSPALQAMRALLPAGLLAYGTSLVCRALAWEPIGDASDGAGRVSQFLLQIGIVCLIVVVFALATVRLRRPSPIIRALAQHSLFIYVAHVCVIYGSPWSPGLRQMYGLTLSPITVLAFVLGLWLLMTSLAVAWRSCGQRWPSVAHRLHVASVTALFAWLVF